MPELDEAACWVLVCSISRGFIWMILRDRVGGGGREKSSFVMTDMVGWAERLRGLSVVVPGDTGL